MDGAEVRLRSVPFHLSVYSTVKHHALDNVPMQRQKESGSRIYPVFGVVWMQRNSPMKFRRRGCARGADRSCPDRARLAYW